MARWSLVRAEPAPVRQRAVVGAATRIHLNRRAEVDKLRLRVQSQEQRLAWSHYDAIGEVKYAFNYFAAAMSRVRIYAAYTPDNRDGPPAPIGSIGQISRDLVTAARYEVAKLDATHGGQAGLLRAFALNLSVAGDMYLIEVGDTLGVYSTQQLRALGTQVQIQPRRNMLENEWITLPSDAFIARIWKPHPAYNEDADSSLMGVASSCEELLMLGRMIRASAMSQINAGLLYVAEELSFQRAGEVDNTPPVDDPNNPDQLGDEDVFEEELTVALTEPVEDETSMSSVVPLLVRGPADMGESAIRKIDLSRPFDQHAVELRDRALDRILNGLDIPKDLVTGLANVRYSNAQQISENLYKAHVEPSAVLGCEALTVTRLRPALIARGFSPDQVARTTIWYDASEVVTSANRSEDADKGWDRVLISDATWRRDHGYSESDAPEETEVARRLAEKTALAPENAIQLLSAVMPMLHDLAQKHLLDLTPAAAGAPPGGPGGKPALPAASADKRAPNESPRSSYSSVTPPPEGTPAPVGVVAAGGQGTPAKFVGDREMNRLLGIERKLRASLQTMLTDMTERALEKAGSRLVSKLRDKPGAMAKVRDVPKAQVAAILGREAVTAAGYTDQQLVNDSLSEAERKYLQQVTQAQAQAGKVLGTPAFGDAAAVEASWSVLKPLLSAYMLRTLFRQETDGYIPKVPMDDVRAALARAGGAQPQNPTRNGPQPGAVLNDAAIEALSESHGAIRGGYRWVYGISENHFQPHLELDGQSFADWSDDALRNPNPTFPRTEHLYPGDHVGCECDALPMLVPVQPHEGRDPVHRETAA